MGFCWSLRYSVSSLSVHSALNPIMRFVSQEVHIPSEDFGPNPFLIEKGIQEGAAREEAARDLIKHPRQLLADIHAESLNPRTDFVARTLARMASMQLRVQEEIANQTKATDK